MKIRVLGILMIVCWIGASPRLAFACKRVQPVSPVEMVANADLILRVTAVAYFAPPASPSRTTGIAESNIRFRVDDLLKGTYAKKELVLPGYLDSRDDWNTEQPPYAMVRSNGQHGSCFANTYREGGQFLLMLKQNKLPSDHTGTSEYTVNWYGLGPVNEQLRSADDPWLLWVRAQLSGPASLRGKAVSQETAKRAVEVATACIQKAPETYRSVGGTPLQFEKATFTQGPETDLVDGHIPETSPRTDPEGIALRVNVNTGECIRLGQK